MPLSPTTSARLDHLLAAGQRKHRLPSVAAGLVRGGELVWSGAVGTVDGRADGASADADTQFRMGSITKTFVAVAVMRLRDAGLLELSDRFGAHVPGSALDDVTIEQLLSHAAGVQAESASDWWERTPGGDWDALVALRGRAALPLRTTLPLLQHGVCRPRSPSRGGPGAPLVRRRARGAARAAGDDAHDVAAHGCCGSGFAVHPFADVLLAEPEHDAGAMAPAGQLWTTVGDLARWAALLGGQHRRGALRPRRSPRWSSRTTSSTSRVSPGPAPTVSGGRSGTTRAPDPRDTAARCPGSSRAARPPRRRRWRRAGR